ncbi:MAG: phosphate ABC transporter substrate-binding protein [Planctomycetes bacterium]|nr:phosphate ABC transporter substrate-binding protein [Planctomycetota bacterium]
MFKLAARAAMTAAVFAAAIASADQTSAKVQADANLPAYAKSDVAVEGSLSSIGSDTMNNLMTFWAEGFARMYPGVKVQIEGKGSSTAPPALIEGTAQFGPMSRDMKAEESDAFEKKYGYKPTRIRTSMDSLAVFVHHDNPIKDLSLAQVDSIFSSTRKRGGKEITTWGQLGLTGDWADKPINLYGRNAASGTYGYFKEHALKKGDYKNSVKEQPGSASVVQGVSEDLYAIGYSGIGYVTSGVRAVGLSEKDGGTVYEANYENTRDGNYPLARFLNLYVNKAPGQPLPPIVGEFCKFILSKEGQEITIKDGYLPLDAKTAEKERKLLD